LSLGFFATGDYGANGLFYGGNSDQLVAQLKGSAFITVATLAIGLLVMYAVKAIGWLRVSPEGEMEGLDIHEHGAPAYHPEYAYMGYSPIPAGAGSGASIPSGVSVPSGE
jgi:Amt family ammonium transporter